MVHLVTPTMQLKSIYVGYGKKYSTQNFFPHFPFLILSEPKELTEVAEPNGPEYVEPTQDQAQDQDQDGSQ